ncbi:hypothetical protein [Hufsiella ginkgonis]|uniref:Uncharacterized protein n=1 Tax=Hufsiella ginkgonis TaxID=2695274 RepID=A0A7K1XUW9_9SPHI|nr:hypothetical protein [Hufsiella ginkgonis]MXV14805.1 hypothetical protein [Hufsiella ginkgonis]
MEKNNAPLSVTLDPIVRELPEYKKTSSGRELQTIIIDAKSDEILHEKPIIPLKKLRYFELRMNGIVFNAEGPALAINHENLPDRLKVTLNYDARINAKGSFRLVRFLNQPEPPIAILNARLQQVIHSYIFKHKEFATNFNEHKSPLTDLLVEEAARVGLDLTPYIRLNLPVPVIKPREFVPCQHTVQARTRDGQVVAIQHALALSLVDEVRFALSGIDDLENWAKLKLDQFTSNVVIDMEYAELLFDMNKKLIEVPMTKAAILVGYELKQLISAPGFDNEKFYFETADNNPGTQREYNTKDPKFKIALNIIVEGKLDLESPITKENIEAGSDIISTMKSDAIAAVRSFANLRNPEECFLEFNQLEIDLIETVKAAMKVRYGFIDLNVNINILESNLSARFDRLQARPFEIRFGANFDERNFILAFRVINVAKEGWYRFRANDYSDSQEELSDIGKMVERWMTSVSFRRDDRIDGIFIKQEFAKVAKRVAEKFGLIIETHDFEETASLEERNINEEHQRDIKESATQNDLLRFDRTRRLTDALEKRHEYMKDATIYEDEIKALTEEINQLSAESKYSKEKFVTRSNTNDFLLASNNAENREEKP